VIKPASTSSGSETNAAQKPTIFPTPTFSLKNFVEDLEAALEQVRFNIHAPSL
jgi:hypothetical protein